MSFLNLCVTVVGGLLAGYVLDVAIRRLPEMLFPGLRAARVPVCPELGVVVLMILATAILVWTGSRFGFTWRGAIYATWLGGLVVLAGIDLRHYLLPDVLTLGLLCLALAASVAGMSNVGWLNALCGAIFGFAVLWCLNAGYRRVRGVDGFGGGDLKMMAALGGWFGVTGVVDVLTLASVLALVGAAIYSAMKARWLSRQTPIPFGPFLAIAAAALAVTRFEGGIGRFTVLS